MNLNELQPRLDTYIRFAKQFPAVYRASIVSHLLAQELPRSGKPVLEVERTPADSERGDQEQEDVAHAPSAAPTGPFIAFDPAAAWTAIAKDLGVPEADVRRGVQYNERGRPHIRVRVDDDTIARKQLAYSALYLYAAEQTGREGATSKELRDLCEEKRALNSPNFTRNFNASDWVKGFGSPRKRDQEWILTQPGRAEARRLLRRLLVGDGVVDAERHLTVEMEPTGEASPD